MKTYLVIIAVHYHRLLVLTLTSEQMLDDAYMSPHYTIVNNLNIGDYAIIGDHYVVVRIR